MKSILLVTPLYPIPSSGNNASGVCHFFARQWVKDGRDVLIVHMQPVYCRPWYLLVRMFGRQLANWAGGGNFYPSPLKEAQSYVMEGVRVFRVPIYKPTPRGRYSGRSFAKFKDKTISLLVQAGFRPEIITAHMAPPETVPALASFFGSKSCLVMHGVDMKLKKRYPDWENLIASYDAVGFRSMPIRKRFESVYCAVRHPFICYSGIPGLFLEGVKERRWDNPLGSFLFVGELLERKHPDTVLMAVPQACSNYSISYIGDGPMEMKLKRHVALESMQERVSFRGRMARKDIIPLYDSSDCFIMVSSGEAFGLVYLEAMARGCIVIASEGEGMDGVIEDGVNGFLCPAGDAGALSCTIRRIDGMAPEEKRRISRAAVSTALRFTDENVARDYAAELDSL